MLLSPMIHGSTEGKRYLVQYVFLSGTNNGNFDITYLDALQQVSTYHTSDIFMCWFWGYPGTNLFMDGMSHTNTGIRAYLYVDHVRKCADAANGTGAQVHIHYTLP